MATWPAFRQQCPRSTPALLGTAELGAGLNGLLLTFTLSGLVEWSKPMLPVLEKSLERSYKTKHQSKPSLM